jgi:hypothetical protein
VEKPAFDFVFALASEIGPGFSPSGSRKQILSFRPEHVPRSGICGVEKPAFDFVFALASEIGPGFSPDIQSAEIDGL